MYDYTLTWLCAQIIVERHFGHAHTQLGVLKYFPNDLTQIACSSPVGLKPLLHSKKDMRVSAVSLHVTF